MNKKLLAILLGMLLMSAVLAQTDGGDDNQDDDNDDGDIVTVVVDGEDVQICRLNLCNERNLPTPVTVNGWAQRSVRPDYVSLGFTVVTTNSSASGALLENSQRINTAIEELLKIDGIQQDNITTAGFNLVPQYDNQYNTTTQSYDNKFLGYQVINQIQLKIANSTQTGEIIDAAVTNGINQVDYINFEIFETTRRQALDDLLADAVADARQRAVTVLAALKYKIAGVKGVQLVDNSVYPTDYATAPSSNAGQTSTQIYSNYVQLIQQVSVTYLITQ